MSENVVLFLHFYYILRETSAYFRLNDCLRLRYL